MDEAAVTQFRKCRGVIRASITSLGTRIKELESKSVDPKKIDIAQHLKEKLETLILSSQLTIMPSLMQLTTNILLKRNRKSWWTWQCCFTTHNPIAENHQDLLYSSEFDTKIQDRKLLQDKDLASGKDEIAALLTHPKDTCLIQQYADWLAEFKTEIKGVHECFLSLDLEESDELFTTYTKLDK